MYSYIKGVVEYKAKDYIVLENSGIGYKLMTSLSTLNKLEIGQEVKISTFLYVREDILSLYGFLTTDELRVFELLISVSGIGPKVANAVLSALSPSKFSLAVITADVAALKGVSGVGLKTAQRIILELKDKLKTENSIDPSVVGAFGNSEEICNEAISALMVLGYSSNEAARSLEGIDMSILSIEEVIKQALKNISKK